MSLSSFSLLPRTVTFFVLSLSLSISSWALTFDDSFSNIERKILEEDLAFLSSIPRVDHETTRELERLFELNELTLSQWVEFNTRLLISPRHSWMGEGQPVAVQEYSFDSPEITPESTIRIAKKEDGFQVRSTAVNKGIVLYVGGKFSAPPSKIQGTRVQIQGALTLVEIWSPLPSVIQFNFPYFEKKTGSAHVDRIVRLAI